MLSHILSEISVLLIIAELTVRLKSEPALLIN